MFFPTAKGQIEIICLLDGKFIADGGHLRDKGRSLDDETAASPTNRQFVVIRRLVVFLYCRGANGDRYGFGAGHRSDRCRRVRSGSAPSKCGAWYGHKHDYERCWYLCFSKRSAWPVPNQYPKAGI